jgi:outer membrane protein TolC
MARSHLRFITDPSTGAFGLMAKTRTRLPRLPPTPGEPKAISPDEALNHRPNALAAQKLIQEARQQVARPHDPIERGRKLGQKAEQTL